MTSVPMTAAGLENLKANLAALEALRPKILTAIREAREKGDLSENAEYHAAREDLSMTEAKISHLRNQINNATLVDISRIGGDAAVFGATVRVQNLDDNEEEEFTLVGEGEADPLNGRILTTTPLGKALLTKRAGDVVEVTVPKGLLRLKILAIRFG